MKNRTISALVKLLEASKHTKAKLLTEQGVLEGEFNLLPIQEWFFTKESKGELGNKDHWNQSFMIRVPELEVEKLEEIIEKLTKQHDILRAFYKLDRKRQICPKLPKEIKNRN